MKLRLYQVDAFTDRLFSGNPAAVVPLEQWLPDDVMQAIAAENNLSETAFLVGGDGKYRIRWFTPTVEVDLCGHATLASGHVVLGTLEPGRDEVAFDSRSGPLAVRRRDDGMLWLDFPAWPSEPCAPPAGLSEALGAAPRDVLRARGLLVVYATEAEVRDLRPDFGRMLALGESGVIVTAPGEEVDFVSRFFAPAEGIPEDPVTGSAHCALTPYWANRLGKDRLRARQVSARGGELRCELRGQRVRIGGCAATYLVGDIDI